MKKKVKKLLKEINNIIDYVGIYSLFMIGACGIALWFEWAINAEIPIWAVYFVGFGTMPYLIKQAILFGYKIYDDEQEEQNVKEKSSKKIN